MGSKAKTDQHGRRSKTNEMIKAFKKDEALLKDILDTDQTSNDVTLWWLGQSGYLIQYQEVRILVDPYLSDSLTIKYQDTEKPHVRISEKVINPENLPRIDFITSSHNHTDHLDAETIHPILKKSPNCRLIIPEANRNFIADRLSINNKLPIGLNAGESFTEDEISFHAIPAAHNQLDKNEEGKHLYLGYIIQLGDFTIYHSGDTLYYEGMEEWIKPFKPSIALLPINGNDPARKVAGNLNATEAVELGKKCNMPVVIPCHYDLFAFNTADVNEFMTIANKSDQRHRVMELGGKFSSHEI
jgi:L-ascorbate metabolism protein UlaG (beta-lactamase superfamily)